MLQDALRFILSEDLNFESKLHHPSKLNYYNYVCGIQNSFNGNVFESLIFT